MLCGARAVAEPGATPPETFLVAPAHYAEERAAIATAPAGSTTAIAAQTLRHNAELKLKAGPWSVMEKKDKQIAPSGDKHDYVSLSPYWWPKPDGTYEWRDGVTNPDLVTTDEESLAQMIGAVKTLAAAGYFLQEERYLERAAFLLRHWFLDPATRMNPNLNFAAGIPGQTTGRGIGLHRLKDMPLLIDAIGLVGTSPHWTAADRAGLKDWMTRYLDWALTSKAGQEEKNEPNNHAVYYGAQMLAAALYTGNRAATEEYSQRYFQRQLIRQIEASGEMPQEMKRTRPYNYAVYTAVGFCYYAELARGLGQDYYHFRGPDGQTLAGALAWLTPYLGGKIKSPKPQDEAMRLDRIFPAARLAALRGPEAFFEPYLEQAFPKWQEDERNLLWPWPQSER